MSSLYPILPFVRHFFSAKRNGHGIHSPFVYALCEEVFYNDFAFYDFETLANVRRQLWDNRRRLDVGNFGAGSRTLRKGKRRVGDIARKGISGSRQSRLFYRLINYLKCNSCVELGTSLGLNTLYLAAANRKGKVTSIEGSQALYEFATELAKVQQYTNIHFIQGDFDQVLPEVLQALENIDFLYVDGNHTCAATLRYFELALPKITEASVIIFDDIYWSKGMTEAWHSIKQHPAVTLSIDAFYFGMVFFRKEMKEKTDLKIYL